MARASAVDLESRIAVSKARRVLQVFRELDQNMPIGQAVAFLTIYEGQDNDGGGLTVTELQKQGGFALSSASRYTNGLAEKDRRGQEGLHLITNDRDPASDARKILRMTPKGDSLVSSIRTIMKGT